MLRDVQMSDSAESASERRVRVGLIGVSLLLLAVIAIFTLAEYTIETVLGITIPYPEITTTVIWAIVGLVWVWVLGNSIQKAASQLIGTESASTARKIITVVLIVAIVFATLSRIGVDLSGYLVSLGITAIVIGFAAQATIGNLIAGMLVLVSKPFRKGDYIRVNIAGSPVEGRVDELSFLRSRLVTNDGVSISIPNTVMLNTPISNFTVFKKRPIVLNISLDRGVPPDLLRSKIEAAGFASSENEVRLYVKGYNQDATTMELWVQVATHSFLKERSQIIHTIQEICKKEKIALKRIELQT